jgi:hypothetical protein
MIGAIKLGIAVGLGYAVGGDIGIKVLGIVDKNADVKYQRGAMWGGRVATFAIVATLLARV